MSCLFSKEAQSRALPGQPQRQALLLRAWIWVSSLNLHLNPDIMPNLEGMQTSFAARLRGRGG